MKKYRDLRIPYTWEERRPVLLNSFLYIPPLYDRHEEWKKLPFFLDNKPLVIEYCSGNGEWICNQAKNESNLNWIAVEKRFDRARKIWARLHRENISNLIVVCGEALTFTRYYVEKKTISKIYVNFPDPWPKLRHAKHRLVSREFVDEVEQVLLPNAKAIFTTDDGNYAQQMQEVVKWKKINGIDDLTDFGSSYFLDLWKQKGRYIYQLQYEYDHTCL